MERLDPTIFRLHADMCKMLANPKRLMILTLLNQREMSVGEVAEHLDAPMATVSQHLGALRGKNLVEARKEGQTVYYRIRDRRILEACILIRSVLIDTMKERGELAHDVSPEGFSSRSDRGEQPEG